MHHVEAVHVVDRDGHLREDGERVVLLEGPLGEQLLEELAAAHILHHEVEAVVVLVEVLECGDRTVHSHLA